MGNFSLMFAAVASYDIEKHVRLFLKKTRKTALGYGGVRQHYVNGSGTDGVGGAVTKNE